MWGPLDPDEEGAFVAEVRRNGLSARLGSGTRAKDYSAGPRLRVDAAEPRIVSLLAHLSAHGHSGLVLEASPPNAERLRLEVGPAGLAWVEEVDETEPR